ncbi:MAG: hypothetical protein LBH43_15460 [Treponema sp.]|nr:hypothetical protein [Treponema sp.]
MRLLPPRRSCDSSAHGFIPAAPFPALPCRPEGQGTEFPAAILRPAARMKGGAFPGAAFFTAVSNERHTHHAVSSLPIGQSPQSNTAARTRPADRLCRIRGAEAPVQNVIRRQPTA